VVSISHLKLRGKVIERGVRRAQYYLREGRGRGGGEGDDVQFFPFGSSLGEGKKKSLLRAVPSRTFSGADKGGEKKKRRKESRILSRYFFDNVRIP